MEPMSVDSLEDEMGQLPDNFNSILSKVPSEVWAKVVDTLLEEMEADAHMMDFRGHKYANIAMVNKEFANIYLRFYTKFPTMKHEFDYYDDYENLHTGVVQFYRGDPPKADPYRFETTAAAGASTTTSLFKGPYIASPGVLKLLAARGWLGGLKRVQISLMSAQCGAASVAHADRSPIECLLHLLRWEQGNATVGGQVANVGEEPKDYAAGDELMNSTGLALDVASVNFKDPMWSAVYESIYLDCLLGLNATSLELSIATTSIFTPPRLIFSKRPAAITTARTTNAIPVVKLCFNCRVTTLRIDINTVAGDAFSFRHPTDVDTFPAHEWRALILQLLAVCPALRELRIHFHVQTRSFPSSRISLRDDAETIKKALGVYGSAVISMANQVLGVDPAIKMAPTLIEVKFELKLSFEGGLPISTHPLFTVGSLKSQQLLQGNICRAMERELVVVEDGDESQGAQSSSPMQVGGQSCSKRVSFEVAGRSKEEDEKREFEAMIWDIHSLAGAERYIQ